MHRFILKHTLIPLLCTIAHISGPNIVRYGMRGHGMKNTVNHVQKQWDELTMTWGQD
jgi:hypothetical protein